MKKKIILMTLVFVLLAIPAAYLQMQKGVMLDGRFFVQKNEQLYVNGKSSVSVMPTEKGADISILLDGEKLDAVLTVKEDLYTFVYGDGRTVQGYAGEHTDELVNEDGVPICWKDSIVITVGNETPPGALTKEYSLSGKLYQMTVSNCEQRGHVLAILMALLVYALGMASYFWPEEVHFFGSRWLYANAELSAAGIAVQKIAGIACAIAGVVLLYVPLFW